MLINEFRAIDSFLTSACIPESPAVVSRLSGHNSAIVWTVVSKDDNVDATEQFVTVQLNKQIVDHPVDLN